MVLKTTIQHNNQSFDIDLSKPLDISISLTNDEQNPIAWYQDIPVIEPVRMVSKGSEWIGKVAAGTSATNFNNIFFNPHAHGTHTECLGHITSDFYSINQCLKQFFFTAEVVSIAPVQTEGNLVITKKQIENALQNKTIEAIIIRTLPNLGDKKHLKYSNTNPAYLSEEASLFIREIGIQHLLIDLPSVDKEHDEGKLLAHKAFWNVKNTKKLNNDARLNCTITEMIYVANTILDGSYILNLQIASFENDASPSKPILYEIL